jgi:hypothetical protein
MANLVQLACEAFSSPSDVMPHIEYVLAGPAHKFPGMTENVVLLVRRNGKDKAVAVEIERVGGEYRVKSAYDLAPGQLERKIEKANQSGGRTIHRPGAKPPAGETASPGSSPFHDRAFLDSSSSGSDIPPSAPEINPRKSRAIALKLFPD